MEYLLTAILIGIPLIAAAPFFRELFRKPVDHSKAPGKLAKLSQGLTHYRWFGPEGGPVVVCVHGQSTPSDAYLAVAQKLGAKGYRVLIYDIYGRGYSSNGNGPQTRDFLVRQLEDLIEDQGIAGKFTLFGYSMGGLIVPEYSSRHLDRVERIMLLVPGGFWKAVPFGRITRIIASHPFLADWTYAIRGSRILEIGIRSSMGEKIDVPGIHQIQLDQLDRRGFRYAVSSAVSRDMFFGDNQTPNRAIHKARIPVLAVWGGQDDVIPPETAAVLTEWNPSARHELVDDAGHGLPYTHSDRIVAAFEAFVADRKTP